MNNYRLYDGHETSWFPPKYAPLPKPDTDKFIVECEVTYDEVTGRWHGKATLVNPPEDMPNTVWHDRWGSTTASGCEATTRAQASHLIARANGYQDRHETRRFIVEEAA